MSESNLVTHFRLSLVPDYLRRDCSEIDLSTTILNGRCRVSLPIGIAPTAFHKFAHPLAELATATGSIWMT